MKDRIKQLMQVQHMNQQAFSEMTGIGTASLSSIFTGRTQPTLNHVTALHKTFPDLNLNWLQFGEGGMFNSANESSNAKDKSNASTLSSSSSPIYNNGDDGADAVDSSLYTAVENNNSDIEEMLSAQRSEVIGDGLLPFASDESVGMPSVNTQRRASSRLPGVRGGQATMTGNQPVGSGNRVAQQTNLRQQQMAIQGQSIGINASSLRKITEIRVFYDDQTFESFVPKSKN